MERAGNGVLGAAQELTPARWHQPTWPHAWRFSPQLPDIIPTQESLQDPLMETAMWTKEPSEVSGGSCTTHTHPQGLELGFCPSTVVDTREALGGSGRLMACGQTPPRSRDMGEKEQPDSGFSAPHEREDWLAWDEGGFAGEASRQERGRPGLTAGAQGHIPAHEPLREKGEGLREFFDHL